MEEPQARINPNPAFPTEQNLALKRYAVLEDLDQVLSPLSPPQTEPKNFVGMLSRQQVREGAAEKRAPRPARQRRKAQVIQPKPPSSLPGVTDLPGVTERGTSKREISEQVENTVRQLRQINSQLSPDELKRLQLCAKTINQLLVDLAIQTEKQSEKLEPREKLEPKSNSQKSSSQKSSSQKSSKKARSPVAQPPKKLREVTLPNLNGTTPNGTVPMSKAEENATPPEMVNNLVEPERESERDIEQELSYLLAELERAITRVNPAECSAQPAQAADAVQRPSPESGETGSRGRSGGNGQSPNSMTEDGQAVASLTMSASGQNLDSTNLNWKQAEQESVETAEALRYLLKRELHSLNREQPFSNTTEFKPPPKPRRTSQPPTQQASKRPVSHLRRFLQIPPKPLDKVGDALLWVMVAAVIRVGFGFLLEAFPGLKPVLTLLMLAPVALTVYLVLRLPKAGWLWLYRPFLLLLGLLLGGRV
jgi:hypothetical protein